MEERCKEEEGRAGTRDLFELGLVLAILAILFAGDVGNKFVEEDGNDDVEHDDGAEEDVGYKEDGDVGRDAPGLASHLMCRGIGYFNLVECICAG